MSTLQWRDMTIESAFTDVEVLERAIEAIKADGKVPQSLETSLFFIHKFVNEQEQRKNSHWETTIRFIADLFLLASGTGLKNPSIRLKMGDFLFTFKRHNNFHTLNITVNKLEPGTSKKQGEKVLFAYFRSLAGPDFFYPWKQFVEPGHNAQHIPMRDAGREFLKRINTTPQELHRFFVESSKDMDACCYCGLPLSDETSKHYGYGKVCAGHYGLPWTAKKDRWTEKSPTFAECYDERIAGMCQAIRENPRDQFNWDVLRDYLQDLGIIQYVAGKDDNGDPVEKLNMDLKYHHGIRFVRIPQN